jgi:hypothetical protein
VATYTFTRLPNRQVMHTEICVTLDRCAGCWQTRDSCICELTNAIAVGWRMGIWLHISNLRVGRLRDILCGFPRRPPARPVARTPCRPHVRPSLIRTHLPSLAITRHARHPYARPVSRTQLLAPASTTTLPFSSHSCVTKAPLVIYHTNCYDANCANHASRYCDKHIPTWSQSSLKV